METRVCIITDSGDLALTNRVNEIITSSQFMQYWEVADVKLISTKWADRVDFTAMVIFKAKEQA